FISEFFPVFHTLFLSLRSKKQPLFPGAVLCGIVPVPFSASRQCLPFQKSEGLPGLLYSICLPDSGSGFLPFPSPYPCSVPSDSEKIPGSRTGRSLLYDQSD